MFESCVVTIESFQSVNPFLYERLGFVTVP